RPACPVISGGTCPLAAGADVIVVAMPVSPERDELVAAHRSGSVPVVVIEPGSTPITTDSLVAAARSGLDDAETGGGTNSGHPGRAATGGGSPSAHPGRGVGR